MASLVGSASWQVVRAGATWALPVGTQAGDLIVAAYVGHGYDLPAGFTPAVRGRVGLQGWLVPGEMLLATRWATAGMSSVGWGPQPPHWRGIMAVFVLRGTTGVGKVRSNMMAVPVCDGGAAVFLAADYSTPRVPPGPSWSATEVLARPELGIELGSKLYARWGWQDAPPGGGMLGGEFWGMAIELLPPAGPFAPELVTPEDGVEVTAAPDAPLTLGWRHRPSRSGGSQDGFELRATRAGVTQYWSVASQAWSASAVINPGSAQTATLPMGALVLEQAVQWQVRTREALDGQWSPWSPVRLFTRVAPPTVTVTGPTGTVTDDLAPWVTWTPTTPRGVQTAYRVEVLSAADVPLWDSGVIAGSDTSLQLPPTIAWQRLAVHQARATIQQSGGSWSLPGTSSWTMTWTQPAAPSITLDTNGPGVGVAVSAGAAQVVEVQRSTDGAQFVPLATWTGGGKIRDVFATYGVPTRYRARTGTVLDGQRLWSDWAISDPITSTDHCSYIASAVDPATTWQRLLIRADRTRRHVRETTVSYGLGDTRPRVSHGPRRGMAGSMEVRTETAADTDALEALLLLGEALQVRMPTDGRAITGRDLPEIMTVAVAAAPTRDRLAQTALIKGRIVTFEWVEQDPPALGASMAPVINPIDRTGA